MTILLTAAAILTGYLAAAVLLGRVLDRADTEPDPRALPVIDAAAAVLVEELMPELAAYLEDAP
jgi:hypothetical protein